MALRDLALEGLQQTINGLLAMDPAALAALAELHGRTIRVEIGGAGLALNFVPGRDGRLQVLGRIEGEPDCTLSGSPLDLMRAGDPEQGAGKLFAGRVRMHGDQATAQTFGAALGGLDIDWEEQLSRLIGDIAAHEVGRAARAATREVRRVRDASTDTLSDYLTEESRLLPHRFEVEAFLGDVDTLRDDVARLEARVDLLERRKADADQ